MDSNGTRFHLLLGRDDWTGCTASGRESLPELREAAPLEAGREGSGFKWDEHRSDLTLEPRLFQFGATPGEKPPQVEDRRGAGRDAYSNWYWIADSRTKILVNSSGSGVTSHFWASADDDASDASPRYGEFGPLTNTQQPAPFVLRGLAVTEDHYLVVGVLKSADCPAGLLIFDLHAGGSPRRLWWPDTVDFAPFDIAPAPGGGVWVLDIETDKENDIKPACYWGLDRYFNVVGPDGLASPPEALTPEEFQPVDGSEERRATDNSFPGSFALGPTSPPDDLEPVSIEGLPDGTVLVLYRSKQADARFSYIYRYELGHQRDEGASTNMVCRFFEGESEGACRLVAHDMAFVPAHEEDGDPVPDRLYVVSSEGNQAFAFHLYTRDGQLVLDPEPEYLPMRLFGGKGLVAAGNEVFYDMGDRWIQLVAQVRPRYVTEATLYTPLDTGEDIPDESELVAVRRGAFDGKVPDCVWHRLMLDACIPPGTEVQVWSRAANTQADLQYAPWRPEPGLYNRGDGSELAFAQQTHGAGDGALGRGTWELLFQEARGQYMQLKLTMRGNGRSTPRITALRAYYPRFSYLERYLPAVYREDAQSASFLDRFLANLEGFYTSIEDKIAAAQVLFDVRSAPRDTLDWLAGWFDVALDPTWDERKRRLFIEHATQVFQYRGTIQGIQLALRLAFDSCVEDELFTGDKAANSKPERIRILEKYRTRQTPGVVFGDPGESTGLREVDQTGRWQPKDGRDVLNSRYQEALQQALDLGYAACKRERSEAECEVQYRPIINRLSMESFPLRMPAPEEGEGKGAVWTRFAIETLGFVPSAGDEDLAAWQSFLARRYVRIAELNRAYNAQVASFESVSLPERLPQDGYPLADWYAFESLVLPVRDSAHRFTVLLPTPEGVIEPGELARREALADRIVRLEKPAHTIFDVKFYWSLFRVGDVRLGDDTLLGLGSRSPQLLSPAVLGRSYLAESHLGPARDDKDGRQILEYAPLGA